ncbi:MAG TPA: hypothetical protein VIL13_06140 [Longimicrobiales bacterium]|jgi:hypothetical protein
MATMPELPEPDEPVGDPPGIVIQDRREPPRRPLIGAFIWGGKVRPRPTLPFGRWKEEAAAA